MGYLARRPHSSSMSVVFQPLGVGQVKINGRHYAEIFSINFTNNRGRVGFQWRIGIQLMIFQ